MSNAKKKISRVAQFIGRRIYELQSTRSQLEIARRAGFDSPNMLSMLKSGGVKLALDRVPRMAVALDCDAAELARLALEQYYDAPTLELIAGALNEKHTPRHGAAVSTSVTVMLVEAQLALRDAKYAAQLARAASSKVNVVEDRLRQLQEELHELDPVAPVNR